MVTNFGGDGKSVSRMRDWRSGTSGAVKDCAPGICLCRRHWDGYVGLSDFRIMVFACGVGNRLWGGCSRRPALPSARSAIFGLVKLVWQTKVQ